VSAAQPNFRWSRRPQKPGTAQQIVSNMIESAEQFIRLRSSEDPAEYNRAAQEEASLEVWREVIDRYPGYRFWVAQNKTVPIEILAVLAMDRLADVREMVARKRKLTSDLQVKLAQDPNETVRLAIATNAKICEAALNILVEDKWEPVRDVAKSKLSGNFC
jgi:hypothetical protein